VFKHFLANFNSLVIFYLLIFAAGALFIAHVGLLLASFSRSGFSNRRYFYSHLTLWLTGICVFVLAWLFHGRQMSGFLDYFGTASKLAFILVFTAALSLIAHLLIRLVVLPM
jgi:hypothetical protein